MKPILARVILRESAPRNFFKGQGNSRFSVLRNESPASVSGTSRDRSVSVKRKSDDMRVSYSAVVQKHNTITYHCEAGKKERIDESIVKVKSLCSATRDGLKDPALDPRITSLLELVCSALEEVVRVQESVFDEATVSPVDHNPGKKSRLTEHAGYSEHAPISLGENLRRSQAGNPQEDPKVTTFKEAVREAERSTLIFNLDMGNIPLRNPVTIGNKATMALTKMAAAEENSRDGIPSEEAVAAIDDILSLAKKVEYFGAVTKTYRNPKDVNNGKFYTLPVKYEFKNKETKIFAEDTLRKRCKVHCTAPYPLILRECIKQVTEQVKKDKPNSQVKVNIDIGRLALRAYWRESEASSEGKSDWQLYDDNIVLPDEVYDTKAKKVPEGFNMGYKGKSNTAKRLSRKDSHEALGSPMCS